MKKSKSKEVSTKIFKFDIDFILKNYLDQRLWNKTWTIFEYDGLKLSMRLTKIDLQDRNIYYEIVGTNDKYNTRMFLWYSKIPIDLQEENKQQYIKSFHRTCFEAISSLEWYAIFFSDAYIMALKNEDEYNDTLKDIANEFLDKNDVTNKAIRDAYIDAYVSDNSIKSYTSAVAESQRDFRYSRYFLTLSLYFGRDDLYEKYNDTLKQKGKGTTELRSAMMKCVNFKKKLENGDLREEMESSLEDI